MNKIEIKFGPLGPKLLFQSMPTIKENTMPKNVITIEKKELVNKFNEEMLNLAREILEEFYVDDELAGKLESFSYYNKEVFNVAFLGTRKRVRNYYVGRAQALKDMIAFFDVYVDKTGHNMLSVLAVSGKF